MTIEAAAEELESLRYDLFHAQCRIAELEEPPVPFEYGNLTVVK